MREQQEAGTEQKAYWDKVFSREAAFFGEEPSDFAKKSVDLFRREAIETVLELGCGQGRDTFLFARSGLRVMALDYSETAVSALRERAAVAGLAASIEAQSHDVRQPLPFPDGSFDACYSHMLLCMELSTAEIAFLLGEIRRVLRPGGLALYSVRSSFDRHYRTGTHLREEIYEIGGFAVHFFTEEKIRKLARGYAIQEIERMEEGSLPRDLFCVTLRKAAAPDQTEEEKSAMSDPMAGFQAAFDAALAPGALDYKTKQLVALGAALAAGCDP
jgi:SAM-dependent methyltransferase